MEKKLTYEEWREKEIKDCRERCKRYSEINLYERLSNYADYLNIYGKELYQEYLTDDGSDKPIKIATMDDKFLTNNKAVN